MYFLCNEILTPTTEQTVWTEETGMVRARTSWKGMHPFADSCKQRYVSLSLHVLGLFEYTCLLVCHIHAYVERKSSWWKSRGDIWSLPFQESTNTWVQQQRGWFCSKGYQTRMKHVVLGCWQCCSARLFSWWDWTWIFSQLAQWYITGLLYSGK